MYRLFCLLLFLTPIIGYGQIIENETITIASIGVSATQIIADKITTQADDSFLDFDDIILYRATYFRSKKPLFGSRSHRHTTVIGLDLGTAYGIHASYGISQISRFHQITLSAGLRLAYVVSVFVELHILTFPLKRIGIAGINFRAHQKLSNEEGAGWGGFVITFISIRDYNGGLKRLLDMLRRHMLRRL